MAAIIHAERDIEEDEPMKTLRLALDWTPNINHIGFLIGKELGLYEKHGISLEIIDPKCDNYAVTPGKRLELGEADFAIAPFETVISLNNKERRVHARAVYAILQQDLSSIAVLASSGVSSPRDLDGKSYASYKARYEDHIVKAMIKNDGGNGYLHILYPDKLGIWGTLLEGKAVSTWIFDNWEGIQAETKHVALTRFAMRDFGIPYGYSPVVLTTSEGINRNREIYQSFIKATRDGFLYVQDHQAESRDILAAYLSEGELADVNLDHSIALTAPHFGTEQTCGIMEAERVHTFLRWLVHAGLESAAILEQELYTNELTSTV